MCLCCCLVVVPLRGPRRSGGVEEGTEDSGAYVVTSDIQKVVTRQGQVRTTDRPISIYVHLYEEHSNLRVSCV